MSEIQELFFELVEDGVDLRLDGDQLRYRAKAKRLRTDLIERIAHFRTEIVDLMSTREGTGRIGIADTIVRNDDIPLSYAQERFWFLNMVNGGDDKFTVSAAVEIEGVPDLALLERSLEDVILRHEILRTAFHEGPNGPVQRVAPSARCEIDLVDLSPKHTAELGSASLEKQLSEFASKPFALATGALLRFRMLKIDHGRYVLLICLHHIITDGWSMGLLIRDVTQCYVAYRRGLSNPLHPLEVQYADYALWQRRRLSGGYLAGQLRYWRERLADAPPLLDLPTDRVRPAMPSFDGAATAFIVPAALTSALQMLARRHDATLYMVMLAAFQLLLGRWSGQSDVVVGSPVSGRTHRELEDLIGLFVNMLAMRTDLSGDPSFDVLLARVKATALAAYDNQDVPFEQVVAEVAPERDLRRQPLFQAVLSMLNMPTATLEVEGLRFSRHSVQTHASSVDLTLYVQEADGALHCSFEYATDLFDAATVERLAAALLRVLEQVVARSDAPLSSIALIDPEERRWLLETVNDTSVDLGTATTLDQMVAEQAQRHPLAIALRCGAATMSYQDLDRRANGLAQQLQHQGVGPDVIVAICAERSIELVVGILAILKAGGAYLPIDPAYPSERIAFMLDDARCPIVLTTAAARQNIPATTATIIPLEDIKPSLLKPQNLANTNNLAYVIYTSGSTGKPKGVLMPHRAPINHMKWMRGAFPLEPGDTVLYKTSPSFDAAVWELFDPLVQSGTVVIVNDDVAHDPEQLLRIIKRYKIKKVQFVPAALLAFVNNGAARETTSLTTIYCGGGVLTPELVAAVADKFTVPVVNLYGPTETCIQSTFFACSSLVDWKSVPIGRPIDNTRVYVVDQSLKLQPRGVPGELCIGGSGVALGYLNDPERTVDKFVADPHSADGALMYRSGDRVRWSVDGQLEYVGRTDAMIKLRGFRIEPGEVEAALRRYPAVRDCLVGLIGPDSDHAQLVAAVTVSVGCDCDLKALQTHLGLTLPDYMVPARILMLANFPTLPNGKIDREQILSRFADEQAAGTALPSSDTEKRIAAIWAKTFGHSNLTQDSDFFETGGTSLHSITVVSDVRKAFDIDVPLRLLFEAPTLGGFSRAIDNLRRLGEPAQPAPALPLDYWSPALAVRTGSQANIPLFCIPPSPGLNWVYSAFADALPADQSVILLQATHLADAFPTNVPDLARAYVQLIRENQPRGPYRLMGYSLGGLIALEVAHQLEAGNAQVELLCLGDSEHGDVWAATPPPSDSDILNAAAELWGLPPLADRGIDSDLAAAIYEMLTTERLPVQIDAAAAERITRLLRGHAQLDTNYHAPCTEADILLIQATKTRNESPSSIKLWAEATSGQLITRKVQSSHNELFGLKHSQSIAESFTEVIIAKYK